MAKVFADDVALNYEGTEPYIALLGTTIYDTGGNDDGRLDPGETVDLTGMLRNVGGVDFTNLTTTIESADPYITIIDNSGNFGYLAIDSTRENTTDPYVISADLYTPIGYRADFILIASESGFVDTFNFDLMVGSYDYLVWNPDPTPSSGETIDNILASLDFSGQYATTIEQEDDLNVYKTIFVCTGVFPNKYVIMAGSYEPSMLVDYVYDGGRLYLEGGDVWCYDPSILFGYDFCWLFRIDPVFDGTGDMGPVVGQSGTFTEGMNFIYDGENAYMDRIDTTGTGVLIFKDGDNDYGCGVANDGGIYKTLGTSFQLGGLVDSGGVSTKTVLLDSIMQFFDILPTGVEEITKSDVMLPKLTLHPNPFRDIVEISYAIGRESGGEALEIYDATGRLVKSFRLAPDALRSTQIRWDGTDNQNRKLSSGVYFIRLEIKDYRETEKVILLR